jgi:hypothetical protein
VLHDSDEEHAAVAVAVSERPLPVVVAFEQAATSQSAHAHLVR